MLSLSKRSVTESIGQSIVVFTYLADGWAHFSHEYALVTCRYLAPRCFKAEVTGFLSDPPTPKIIGYNKVSSIRKIAKEVL